MTPSHKRLKDINFTCILREVDRDTCKDSVCDQKDPGLFNFILEAAVHQKSLTSFPRHSWQRKEINGIDDSKGRP